MVCARLHITCDNCGNTVSMEQNYKGMSFEVQEKDPDCPEDVPQTVYIVCNECDTIHDLSEYMENSTDEGESEETPFHKPIPIEILVPFLKKGWVAMNENNEWLWFENEPKIHLSSIWGTFDDSRCHSLSCGFEILPAKNWQESLIEIK